MEPLAAARHADRAAALLAGVEAHGAHGLVGAVLGLELALLRGRGPGPRLGLVARRLGRRRLRVRVRVEERVDLRPGAGQVARAGRRRVGDGEALDVAQGPGQDRREQALDLRIGTGRAARRRKLCPGRGARACAVASPSDPKTSRGDSAWIGIMPGNGNILEKRSGGPPPLGGCDISAGARSRRGASGGRAGSCGAGRGRRVGRGRDETQRRVVGRSTARRTRSRRVDDSKRPLPRQTCGIRKGRGAQHPTDVRAWLHHPTICPII